MTEVKSVNYIEAVAYIEEIPKFTTKHPLEHTKELLRRLGDPQDNMKVIHVAGTNGKGSTCAYLASMLAEGGYRTGLFTSPHLVTINDRKNIIQRRFKSGYFSTLIDPKFNVCIVRVNVVI